VGVRLETTWGHGASTGQGEACLAPTTTGGRGVGAGHARPLAVEDGPVFFFSKWLSSLLPQAVGAVEKWKSRFWISTFPPPTLPDSFFASCSAPDREWSPELWTFPQFSASGFFVVAPTSVIMASLKMASHFENGRLLVISTLPRS
jgi:hypothetical protein